MKLEGQMYGSEPLERVIAKTCHAANIALCAAVGDSWVTWPDAPDWQKGSAINGVRLHWDSLENGEDLPASASHESWMKEKVESGWVYGEVKDGEKKTHPCIVPFASLPLQQRMKDYVFASIVKAYYEGLN